MVPTLAGARPNETSPATSPGRFANMRKLLETDNRPVQCAQLALVAVMGLLLRIPFIGLPGYRDDNVIFVGWLKALVALPPAEVYAHIPGLNYPPMAVVIYEISAIVLHWFDHGHPTAYALDLALKLPPIVCDCVAAVLAYAVVRRCAGHLAALLTAAYFAVDPAIIYDSAYWGQNDSVPIVLAVLALTALSYERTILAWLAITAAIFVKPPVLVLVPLMLLHPFLGLSSARGRRLIETACGIGAALILAEALAVTFFPHPTPFIAAKHLIGQLIGGSSLFNFNSLNAFNLWAILQPFFVTDKMRFLFATTHVWGNVLFIAAAAFIYWRFLVRRDPLALFEAATLVLLAFFLFLTEMHERYLIYAVVFCGVVLIKQPYRIAALILSVTLLLNLEYGLTFMYLDDARATMVDRFEFAPWLVHLCSLANLGVFGWLLTTFSRTRTAQGAPTAAVPVSAEPAFNPA